MDLILLRHTTPNIGPGVCYGQTDLDVAAKFDQEAAAVCSALPAFARIVTSPLMRCRKLAAYLGERSGLTVCEVPDLIEMDFGRWERRPWADIPRHELDSWAEDFMHARPHGGESVAMLKARIDKALGGLWTQVNHNDMPTLAVTHAGVIRAALAKGERAEDFNTNVDFGGFVTLSPQSGDRS